MVMVKGLVAGVLAISSIFALSASDAFAARLAQRTELTLPDCRWNPQGTSLCRGRNFCFLSVYHPKCQRYCAYYPWDYVCSGTLR